MRCATESYESAREPGHGRPLHLLIFDNILSRAARKPWTSGLSTLSTVISHSVIKPSTTAAQHLVLARMSSGQQRNEGTSGSRPPGKGVSTTKRPALTHFLCLPLVTATSRPVLERSLSRFKSELSAMNTHSEASGSPSLLNPQAVRPVGTLHLTLGVMSLPSASQLSSAISLLRSIDIIQMLEQASARSRPIAATATDSASQRPAKAIPLRFKLQGVSAMHSPRSTSVLYAVPHTSTNRLQLFCEQLRDVFVKAGVMVRDDRELKLHVTVVNTIYVKSRAPPEPVNADLGGTGPSAPVQARSGDSGSGRLKRGNGNGKRRRGRPVKFDARGVIEQFRDFVWAEEVLLDRIAICEMGAKKEVDERTGEVVEEAYREVAVRALPAR